MLKKLKTTFTISIMVVLVFGFYIFRIFQPKESTSTKAYFENKLILWYARPNYVKPTEKGSVRPLRACPHLPCRETSDVDLMPNADAVIFDAHFKLGSISKYIRKYPQQVWIFYAQEPPNKIQLDLLKTDRWCNVFNWTVTYRRDSDIWMPYGIIQKRTLPQNKDYVKIASRKNKMASWIVSTCKTPSKRDEYDKFLGDYGVETDIYGKCGRDICVRTKLGHDKCSNITTDTYSFYLAFENSMCKDYITEKLFHNYNENVILVVRGGKDNYKHLPPGTFINTEDFPTIKALAAYMKRLHYNKTEYIAFLKRKDEYKAVEEVFTYELQKGSLYTHFHYLSEPMCDMCRKLLNYIKPQVYSDIYSWYNSNTCHPPTDLGEKKVF